VIHANGHISLSCGSVSRNANDVTEMQQNGKTFNLNMEKGRLESEANLQF